MERNGALGGRRGVGWMRGGDMCLLLQVFALARHLLYFPAGRGAQKLRAGVRQKERLAVHVARGAEREMHLLDEVQSVCRLFGFLVQRNQHLRL
jgi:hypothetical protein